ncbi:MAG: helix-turn-helix transcriptional regulator [Armatimonadetes bacterium]|nr:helix-turn-helix transcriptional regulator [Armatimonadota bacterium]
MPKKLPRGTPEEGTRLPSQIFGENVAIARTVRRLTQGELADRMSLLGFPGWQQSTVSQIERGLRAVDIDELWSLAFALNTTIDFLLDPSGSQGADRMLPSLYLGPETDPVSAFHAWYYLSNRDPKAGHPPWPADGVRVRFLEQTIPDQPWMGVIYMAVFVGPEAPDDD